MTSVRLDGGRRRRGGMAKAGLGAVPLTAWLVLFFLVPSAVVLYYSFGYKPDVFSTHATDVLSLDRYADAITPAFLAIFQRTVRIAAVGTLVCVLVAFPIAYWMAVKLPARWRGVVLAMVLVPYWTNFLIRTIGWQIALSPEGFLSKLLAGAGLLTGPLEILYTPTAVQIGVVYNYLPLMILPLYVTLERLDPKLLEASRDLGASAWRTFTRVTLPLSVPGLAAGSLLVFVPLMGDYVTPSVLGGASGSMVGQMVAGQFQAAQNWPLGAAMAVLLILAILGLIVLVALVARVAVGVAKNLSTISLTPREA
ncbi:ABC transporter permease [Georgenia yuyongxinii]|nr:ABC transporter permease [Georgenia yuyongxinii]